VNDSSTASGTVSSAGVPSGRVRLATTLSASIAGMKLNWIQPAPTTAAVTMSKARAEARVR
jgi:hypothetical protein